MPSSKEVVLLVGLVVVVSFISFLLAYLIGKRNLSIEIIAKALVEGREFEEANEFICKESIRIHKEFEKTVRSTIETANARFKSFQDPNTKADLTKLITAIKNYWSDDEVYQDVIQMREKLIIFRDSTKRRRDILAECINIVAISYRIDVSRFEKHIIQYNPIICASSIQRFIKSLDVVISNLDELVENSQGLDEKTVVRRLRGLFDVFRNIQYSSRRRIIHATDLLENTFLHDQVIALSSCDSTTGSVLIYAEGVSIIPEIMAKLSYKEAGFNIEQVITAIVNCLKFYYRKQKAYPGYDPHLLLVSLLNKAIGDCDLRMLEHNKLDLRTVVEILGFVASSSYPIKQVNYDKLPSCLQGLSSKEDLDALIVKFKKLNAITDKSLTHYKQELVQNVKRNVIPQVNTVCSNKDRLFIVTHGYSKTIRQILQHSLHRIDNKSIFIFALEGKESMRGGGEKLRQEVERYRYSKPNSLKQFLVGDAKTFLNIYNPNKDALVTWIGAECADVHAKAIMAKGFLSEFTQISRSIGAVKPMSYTLFAESFRVSLPSIIQESPFDDHYDRISIVDVNEHVSVFTEDTHLVTPPPGSDVSPSIN